MIVPVPPLGRRSGGHIPTPASGRISIPSTPAAFGQIPTPSAPVAQPGCIPAPSAPPASAVSGPSVPAAEKTSRKDVAGVGLARAALVGGMAVVGAVIGDEV